ncbi:MAG: PilZ domain-containing protein [Magnetococcales bacterium]|nr:PilZ domain-containing protein [Magnetococcales bacterium]
MESPNQQRRRHERFEYHNAVTLRLADGRVITGRADNMGFGGAAMIADEEPSGINVGDHGQIRVTFFGRPSDYPCTIVSIKGMHLGLQIQRSDYQGAPENLLSAK